MPDADDAIVRNVSPVSEEVTVTQPLPVDGAIPPVLDGLLVRNGPNPYAPGLATADWLLGDGMVHAVELREGRAVSYRNRWVRTRALAQRAGTRIPPGPPEPVDGPANSHVIWYGGRLLALGETGFPVRLTSALDTVRVEDFDGALTSPMAAHPHADPDTGGWAFWGDDPFGPPYLRYHEADATGTLVHSTDIYLARPTVHHDCAVTATRLAVLDWPVVLDLEGATRGSPVPARWDRDGDARIGVLPRGAPGDRIRWTATEPGFAHHVVNAFDDGDALVIDLCRYSRYPGGSTDLAGAAPYGDGASSADVPAHLERWRVADGRVSVRQLDDRVVELPRVDDTLAGRHYRFAYCTDVGRGGLVRYDMVADEATVWDPGPRRAAGEPIFVRDPDGDRDDEGWVLTVVYDAERDASDVVILDGTRFGGRPEAVVHLPARIPDGLHGSWVPADRYR